MPRASSPTLRPCWTRHVNGFPRRSRSGAARLNLLKLQGKLDQAQSLLDQAQKILGDSANLELARVRLLFARGGADLPKMLGELAQKSRAFAPGDRRRLIEVLAPGAARLGDLALAKTLWSEVASSIPMTLALGCNCSAWRFRLGTRTTSADHRGHQAD